MVSAFLTPIGILKIPDHISDDMLPLDWPRDSQQKVIREACQMLEYGKDNYWTAEKLIDHISIAVLIFDVAFPHCQALFAFDNATNHCSFASDALVASKMNFGPGGQQPKMRDGFDHRRSLPHQMNFSRDHPNESLRGKPKGTKIVLEERGLWSDFRSDGTRLLHKCKSPGCPREGPLHNVCCATTILSQEKDFQEQKGRVQELVEGRAHAIIFYPKFHCELNFIERFWCSCKRYTRDRCSYSFQDLRQILPRALASVPTHTIHRYHMHCERTIDAYISGNKYGTKQFTESIRNYHRSITDTTRY